MLNQLGSSHLDSFACEQLRTDNSVSTRYERNEQEDMKKAVDYLYEFKKKMAELHPSCLNLIENMLQRPRY